VSGNNGSKASGGVGFGSLLALLFIALKLCGVIAWSWWWVLSPLWIGFLLIAVILAFALLFAAIAHVCGGK